LSMLGFLSRCQRRISPGTIARRMARRSPGFAAAPLDAEYPLPKLSSLRSSTSTSPAGQGGGSRPSMRQGYTVLSNPVAGARRRVTALTLEPPPCGEVENAQRFREGVSRERSGQTSLLILLPRRRLGRAAHHLAQALALLGEAAHLAL